MFIDTLNTINLTHANRHLQELDPDEFWSVDDIVEYISKEGKRPDLGGLHFREYVYVALASNSQELLTNTRLTMVKAFGCIGPEARERMLKRWIQYRRCDFRTT